jgi:hypothetical protein
VVLAISKWKEKVAAESNAPKAESEDVAPNQTGIAPEAKP